MQLERIALRLRPRNPWEALDLGLPMAATWRGPALRAWLATFGLATVLLCALFIVAFGGHIEYALLLVWWLKPAFDRVLLHVYGHALFGEPPTVRAVWKALPGLMRRPGLLSALTLRRFSMARSFLLPVWQLEQQRGKGARQRFRQLAARLRGQAAWLTFFCANANTILWFGGLALIQMLTPTGYEAFDWSEMLNARPTLFYSLLNAAVYVAAESLIEPYYVAAGFALYLNRRSDLEGWDIELAFRQLTARKTSEERRTPRKAAAWLLALGVAALTAGAPGDAQAADTAEATDTTEAPTAIAPTVAPPAAAKAAAAPPSLARRTIDEVLADPVFGKKVDDTRWQWIDDEKPRPDGGPPRWWGALRAFVNGLSAVMKVLVGLAALAALGLLLWMLWRTRHQWAAERRRTAPPEVLFGFDVRPESLPDDIAAAALNTTDAVAALSLLYRGSLVTLIHRHQAEFREGDTEADCLQRSRPHLPEAGQRYFTELVDAWRRSAYGATLPSAEALRGLCQRWPEHFARPAASEGAR